MEYAKKMCVKCKGRVPKYSGRWIPWVLWYVKLKIDVFLFLKLFPAKSHLIHTSGTSCGGPLNSIEVFSRKWCQAHLAVVCRRHQTRSHYGEGCQLGPHFLWSFSCDSRDQLVQSLYWSHYIDGLGLALFGENRSLERFPMSFFVCRLWHCWNSRLFFLWILNFRQWSSE